MILKKITSTLIIAFVASILFSCATTGPVFEQVPSEQIPEGSSVVYLYRPSSFAGWAAKFNISINNGDKIKLTNGGYYPYICGPGEYTITWTIGKKTPTVNISVEEGKEYYVKSWMKVIPLIVVTVSEYHLDLMEKSIAKEEILACKRIE